MIRKATLALAGAIALLAGLATGAAAVDTLSIRPAGRITAVAGALTFSDAGGLVRVTCAVTLGGTLSGATMDKLAGTVIGGLTSASASGCSGGTARFLAPTAERPWPIVYNEILGTLPSEVTGIQLEFDAAAVSVTASFLTCLYRGDLQAQLAVTGRAAYTGETITSQANSFGLVSGALCPRYGTVTGTLRLSPTQIITPVFELPPPVTSNPRSSVRYGVVAAGASSEIEVVYTNNHEGGVVTFLPALGGIDTGAFTINDVNCTFAALLERESCTMRLRFSSAGAPGDVRSAWVALPYTLLAEFPFTKYVNLIGKVG
jgi:hypothetical protein